MAFWAQNDHGTRIYISSFDKIVEYIENSEGTVPPYVWDDHGPRPIHRDDGRQWVVGRYHESHDDLVRRVIYYDEQLYNAKVDFRGDLRIFCSLMEEAADEAEKGVIEAATLLNHFARVVRNLETIAKCAKEKANGSELPIGDESDRGT